MKTIKKHNENIINHTALIYPNNNDFKEYLKIETDTCKNKKNAASN